jgi:thiamine pyrophosphate-dependent acetolactate synthase large subunit-like protein
MGAFQEERQVLIASPFCKFVHAIDTVQRIPYYVEMATRNAIYGRPGATYLDMPDDIITGKCDEDKVILELAESFDRLARAAATPAVLRRRESARKDRQRNW